MISLSLCVMVFAHANDANGASHKISQADIWAPLTRGLEAWTSLQFDADFSINVGSEAGTLYTWNSPGSTMYERRVGASLSKWPSAIMISGLVADGIMSFDDKANKYLRWWAKDG